MDRESSLNDCCRHYKNITMLFMLVELRPSAFSFTLPIQLTNFAYYLQYSALLLK